MSVLRDEIQTNDRWNVEALFPHFQDWETAAEKAGVQRAQPEWPSLIQYKGHFAESPGIVKKCLDQLFQTERELSRLYTYAHLRHDEEITHDQGKIALQRTTKALHEFNHSIAWLEPELIALPEATQKNYLTSSELAPYRFYLEKTFRQKAHTLSPEQEELIALAGQPLQGTHKAFSALNDADLIFGEVVDSGGKSYPITHARYVPLLLSPDRTLRQNAFLKYHNTYASYGNTLCELIHGTMQAHWFSARAHKFSSCLEAALFPKNLDVNVYHSLLQAVQNKIGALHKYVGLRKKILKLDTVHLYDLYLPLVRDVEIKLPFEEAVELILASLKPLGKEYQKILHQGLTEQRWVDRYENKHKRSGAYSSGCYDSYPYILMNYRHILRDVFTLAHEAGHSMHSYLSHQKQPYQYGDYPIFLAEVASTFNEELLMQHMLEKATSSEQRIYLINQKIEDIRGTLFRQTMFAEFELKLHTMVEQGEPLTPSRLNALYQELNQKYYGPALTLEDAASSEWSRIPHFYYNYYVFQYATGISAALALADRVLQGGESERRDYLGFLEAGSSRFPLDILASAGIDMRTARPVELAIQKFEKLVDQLDKELNK